MKTLVLISIVTIFTLNSFAQDKSSNVETTKFEVKGVCDMCKERIENAALIKGVKRVEWDKATDTLTVIYRKDKIDIMEVHKAVAEVGHTTDKVECNIDAYNKLSACCKYMSGVEKH